jgi:hypothetical protein
MFADCIVSPEHNSLPRCFDLMQVLGSCSCYCELSTAMVLLIALG